MVALIILMGIGAILLVLFTATRAPNIAEKLEHKETQKEYRKAIVLLDKAANDPLYPTTIDFQDRATRLVEHYYEEN